ncbi:blood group Rh(CE) polypeptide isoform X1 [Coturnix japonica]|uniref:Rh blood group CcEe antigens n=2 Tax=Coturnix japonica TaxID=93934 RepID=A0A8C2TXM9_COTJA|nr:blood group Rh(CE) polypeptide isoform X1 [Coturnix japonica]XP_015738852.1 blood group Rh(CE) polypeptide isoform X1 [Coturnix japonica]XP_032304813.1 blood group Rh(CE) polypeptide isoform X1 [Coturnix japonica]XP_032304814.1 blood group Rh(CE) polypeptide isoform X1 [Coturnix japonica]
MPAAYRSFRCSVPWLILSLEAAFIVLFYFLFSDVGAGIHYAALQDVSHVLVFGFGFFLMFLKRYSFSSVGFNLLIIVLGVQCSILMENVPVLLSDRTLEGSLSSIVQAAMSMVAVVISIGAVLGMINPMQSIVMTIVEIIVFCMSRWINENILEVSYHVSMMHVHLFGAYFGLAVSSRFSEPSPRSDKNASTSQSDLLAMLGTLFLWVFWPSFNSILALEKNKAILNTCLALAVSAVTAFALSGLTTKDGKFRMSHIHRAAMAGGVTIGYAASSINYPWIAMILGLLASVISILGSFCLQSCFNPPLKIHDASGVHFTFGLPAVLGALAQVVFFVMEIQTTLPSIGYQVILNIGAFCFTISTALIAGLITGLILNLKLLKPTPVSKYFDDQMYWEFPHLAVGF